MSTKRNTNGKRSFKRKASKKDVRLSKRQRMDVERIVHQNQELKFVSVVSNNLSYTTAGFLTGTYYDVPISIPSTAAAFPVAGTTDQTRIGDRIKWAGTMEIRMIATNNGATNANGVLRVVVFQWHPSSAPTSGSILLTGPTGAVDVYSTYNHDHRQEYSILLDHTFNMHGNGAAATSPTTSNISYTKFFKINLREKPLYGVPIEHQVQYTNQALTATNRFYMFLVSDSAAANPPFASIAVKTFFRDG